MERSDCILVYGRTTKGDVVKRFDCILVYGSTTKGDVVKRSDCILVYGSTTKGDVVKRSDCILVYGRTTKGDVLKRFDGTFTDASFFHQWRGLVFCINLSLSRLIVVNFHPYIRTVYVACVTR